MLAQGSALHSTMTIHGYHRWRSQESLVWWSWQFVQIHQSPWGHWYSCGELYSLFSLATLLSVCFVNHHTSGAGFISCSNGNIWKRVCLYYCVDVFGMIRRGENNQYFFNWESLWIICVDNQILVKLSSS